MKKFFAKILLPSRRAAARSGPTMRIAVCAEHVDYAGDEWRFRTDYGQVRVDRYSATSR